MKRKDATKAPSAGLNVERPPMIPDKVMSRLSKPYHDLHRMLMGAAPHFLGDKLRKWLFNHENN
jgi:hypothetical protein